MQIAERVVYVEADNKTGTGFIIDNEIYTNQHVAQGASNLRAYDLTGKRINITGVTPFSRNPKASDPNTLDMATLHSPDLSASQYQGKPRINLPGGYYFSVSHKIPYDISPGKERTTNPIALKISNDKFLPNPVDKGGFRNDKDSLES